MVLMVFVILIQDIFLVGLHYMILKIEKINITFFFILSNSILPGIHPIRDNGSSSCFSTIFSINSISLLLFFLGA